MNFGYSVSGLLKGRKVTISVWDRKACVRLSADEREKLREIVDTLGWNSAQAQGLTRPSTDYNRLKASDQRLYLICKPHWVRGTRIIGGLKCGRKHLYFRKNGGYEECQPMCVLDFYIHERYQRKGLGRRLFRHFLDAENEQPNTIAYDGPSQKFLNFLKKHHGCFQLVSTRFAQQSSMMQCTPTGTSRSVQQNNNFAVFDTFFDKTQLFKVKTSDKRLHCLSRSASILSTTRSSRNATLSRDSTTPPRSSITPPKHMRTSTTAASSSIISRYSGLHRTERTSTASIESMGKIKDRFETIARPPLRPISRRTVTMQDQTVTRRLPMGPYPGWQPLDHGPRSEKRRRKEGLGLTRLAPIQNLQQPPPTPLCRCTPPWATGLSADRTTGRVKKIVTASAITSQRHTAATDAAKAAYRIYKGRSVDASGAKNCLRWSQSPA